jgi:hypothetical protein
MPGKIVTHAENLLKSDDNLVSQWVQMAHEEELHESHTTFSVRTGAVSPDKRYLTL